MIVKIRGITLNAKSRVTIYKTYQIAFCKANNGVNSNLIYQFNYMAVAIRQLYISIVDECLSDIGEVNIIGSNNNPL